MKFVALVSGGKDSIYTIHKLCEEGHELVGLLYMKGSSDYQDSFMYQTVGSELITLLGECFGVPLFISDTECESINQELNYVETPGDEVEDLYKAVKNLKKKLEFSAISSGAILSRYQKYRVEDVCKRLSLKSLAPLWEKPQRELLDEMIKNEINAIIVKVASSILTKNCVGVGLKEIKNIFDNNNKYETNYCGEGGEYETFVLDCPMFKKKIVIEEFEVCGHPDEVNKEGVVFFMIVKKYFLKNK